MERSDALTLVTLDHFSHFTLNFFGKPLSGAIQSLALRGCVVIDIYSLLGFNAPQLAAYPLLGFGIDTPGLAPGQFIFELVL